MLEVLLPICLAFCIGIASGYFLSKQIGSVMLNNEIQTEQQQAQDFLNSTTQSETTISGAEGDVEKTLSAAPIKNINISLTPSECGDLALISLLIVLVSVIIPSSSILRFQPRRILISRK